MMTTMKIDAPAGFVPAVALSFGSSSQSDVAVDADHPLPVTAALRAALSAALSGTSVAATTAGRSSRIADGRSG